ncbi:MAG: stalk domain-containing protein [Desulfitobacteriaceae bacterium]|nr:stalk domain-containing protein [Desulfitobacteriaceae bacterium]
MVPVRFVSEALGYKVDWYDNIQTVGNWPKHISE